MKKPYPLTKLFNDLIFARKQNLIEALAFNSQEIRVRLNPNENEQDLLEKLNHTIQPNYEGVYITYVHKTKVFSIYLNQPVENLKELNLKVPHTDVLSLFPMIAGFCPQY